MELDTGFDSAVEDSNCKTLSLTYEDVARATDDFRAVYPWQNTESVKTYRGLLTVFPYEITVKLYLERSFGKQKIRTELRASQLCRHPNVVRCFGGKSLKGDQFMAIYESLSYGTLQSVLYAEATERISWDLRLNIALDIARGVSYLHEDLDSHVHLVHCNLSASAIVFSGLTAKIGRFDLSRLVQGNDKLHSSDRIPWGKLGYMPPEMMTEKIISRAGDVYSFGVIILELITRRHPNKLGWSSSELRSAFTSHHDLTKIIDPTLLPELDSVRESILALLVDVGFLCTEQNPQDRPTMKEMVGILEIIIDLRDTDQNSLRWSLAYEQRTGYSSDLPERVSKILDSSKQTKSTYLRELNNLQVQLLFDNLEGNDEYRQARRDSAISHHGILHFIRKHYKKIFSRFRRKKARAKARRKIEAYSQPEAIAETEFCETEEEQEFFASVILGKRKHQQVPPNEQRNRSL